MDNDLKARQLRYAKREELATALRYGGLYERRTSAVCGGTAMYGHQPVLLPDRAPLYRREVSGLTPLSFVQRGRPLDLRDFFEPVDGIWVPLVDGKYPHIWEFFVDSRDPVSRHPLLDAAFSPVDVLFD